MMTFKTMFLSEEHHVSCFTDPSCHWSLSGGGDPFRSVSGCYFPSASNRSGTNWRGSVDPTKNLSVHLLPRFLSLPSSADYILLWHKGSLASKDNGGFIGNWCSSSSWSSSGSWMESRFLIRICLNLWRCLSISVSSVFPRWWSTWLRQDHFNPPLFRREILECLNAVERNPLNVHA